MADEAVAEHAISFYFALRRNLVGMHAKMVDVKEEWKVKGSLISYVSFLLLPSLCSHLWASHFGAKCLPRECLIEVSCLLLSVDRRWTTTN
jgi:hypothetical protein